MKDFFISLGLMIFIIILVILINIYPLPEGQGLGNDAPSYLGSPIYSGTKGE